MSTHNIYFHDSIRKFLLSIPKTFVFLSCRKNFLETQKLSYDKRAIGVRISENICCTVFQGHNMDDIIMAYVAYIMNTQIKKKPSYAGIVVGESIC